MLDIGWSELAIVAAIALFVIGPRELPKALRTIGHYVGKVRAMAREFQSTIDDAVRDTELEEVKNQIQSVKKINVNSALREAIDPKNELANAFDVNAGSSGSEPTPAVEPDPTVGSGADDGNSIAPPAEDKPSPSSVWPVTTKPPPAATDTSGDDESAPADTPKTEQNAQSSA